MELAGGCDVLLLGGVLVLGELLVSGGLVLLLGLVVSGEVLLTGGCEVLGEVELLGGVEVLGDVVLLLGLFMSLCGMLLPALLQSDEIIFTSVTLIVFELDDEGFELPVAVPALLPDAFELPVTAIMWPTWSCNFEVSPWSEYEVPVVLSVSVKLPDEPLRQPWTVWLLPVVVCEVLVVVVVVV